MCLYFYPILASFWRNVPRNRRWQAEVHTYRNNNGIYIGCIHPVFGVVPCESVIWRVPQWTCTYVTLQVYHVTNILIYNSSHSVYCIPLNYSTLKEMKQRNLFLQFNFWMRGYDLFIYLAVLICDIKNNYIYLFLLERKAGNEAH